MPGSDHGDTSLRCLFEDADIRGETVHLDEAYREILSIHEYAPGVNRLLGEFLAAAVLLSTNLKYEGKLILQVRSEGQIPLLMVECDHKLQVRAIARGAQEATSDNNAQLLTNGQLTITIDPSNGQRYQGIVPLVEDSLAHSLDAYFEQSEQLKSRLWLAADGERAAGLLLQQLPPQVTQDDTERLQQWEHACSLAATVRDEELLQLSAEALLYRLYHEDAVRVFQPASVTFRCSCSRERTRNALASLNPEEVEELLEELGSITMDCEFCNQQYRFTREDLGDVLQGDESRTLH
ncbi:MAG: Hsp33 family molecular chaperone HslO [Gammaproteobacteria bacterium]|nr:Hsp33 family molecular chaperone HslO [Gammaproteobacteria bacterium]